MLGDIIFFIKKWIESNYVWVNIAPFNSLCICNIMVVSWNIIALLSTWILYFTVQWDNITRPCLANTRGWFNTSPCHIALSQYRMCLVPQSIMHTSHESIAPFCVSNYYCMVRKVQSHTLLNSMHKMWFYTIFKPYFHY